MKPWELDAPAPTYSSTELIPSGGLGIDVPVQQGFQVSPQDQEIRDEAARRLKAKESAGPKPWELDASAKEEPASPKIPANYGASTVDTGMWGKAGRVLNQALSKPVQEVISGATHFPRAVMNTVSEGAGDKVFPPQGDESGYYIAGQVLDPFAMGTGVAGGNLLSKLPLVGQLFAKGGYEAMRGKGFAEGVKAASKNVASGAATGAGMAAAAGDDPALGALFGGVVPLGMSGVGATRNAVTGAFGPLRESWRTMQANKALMETLTPDTIARIEQGIANARPGETLGDIIGRENITGASSLAAFERAITGDPRFSGAEKSRQAAREAWRANQLAGVGGFAKGDEAVTAARAGREAATAPLRSRAFEQANVAAKTPDYLKPALADSGLIPLTPESVRKSFYNISQRVGNKADVTVRNVIDDLAQQVKIGMNKDGTIPAEELYTVRKQAGSIINKYAQENKDWDKRKSAGLLIQVQKAIDEAIEDATGNQGTWTRYVDSYAKRSKGIDQMKVGNELLEALRGSPAGHTGSGFLSKVKSLGSDIDVLTPRQLRRVENVSADIRNEAVKNKIADNVSTSRLMSSGSRGEVKVPSMLTTTATITNYVLSKLGHGADDKIVQDMGRLMLNDPKTFQQKYLVKMKPEDASVVQEAIRALRYPVVTTASEE